jgi:hypothetical protein
MVLALCALGATGWVASAETIWLVSNAFSNLKEPVLIKEGLLKVEVLYSPVGLLLEFECSDEFTGSVGPGAAGEITKILDVSLKDVGTLRESGAGADCTVIGIPIICTSTTKLVEFWPRNLPWRTLLKSMTPGEEEQLGEEKVLDIIGLVNGNEKEPGFDFECENSDGTFTEGLCEGRLSTVLTSQAADVLDLFLQQDQSSCFEPGTTAYVTGEGLIVPTSGLSLQVSG